MKSKLALILAFLSLSALFFAPTAHAQGNVVANTAGWAACGVRSFLGQPPFTFCGCDDVTQVNTAIGCISTTPQGFVGSILTIAISLGGGIALLLILYGTFIVTTSAGIPDKLNEGQETITAAVQGLVFIIMSIVLLNLIGIKILQIPGL